MNILPKLFEFIKDEMGGAALFVPLVVAGASIFASKKMADNQSRQMRQAQDSQRSDMQRQQSALDAQNARALKEKEQLQKEESDRIRSGSRKKGRRALLTGDETGTNGVLRKTLG